MTQSLIAELEARLAAAEAALRVQSDVDVRLRENEDRQAFLLKLSDALRPLGDPDEVRRAATRILCSDFGVTRANYYEVDDDQEHFRITQTHAEGETPAADPHLRFATLGFLGGAYRAGETLVFDDIAADPRLDEATRAEILARGAHASVMVPLVKDGRLLAMIGVHHGASRHWTTREVALLQETAERTWAAVERARAETTLREAQALQAFLLDLSDALRPIDDGAEIERVAVRLLGERLGADRVFYASVDPDEEHWSFRQGYGSGAPEKPGRFAFTGYQRKRLAQWRAGEMSSVADSESDPGLDADDRAGYAAFGARAAIGVPLVKHGRFAALLVANQATPRPWTRAELATTREAAERTWQAMERARAEAALRASEDRQRFLLRLSDSLRVLEDPAAIGMVATEALGRRLEFNRAIFFDVGPDGETLRAGPAYLDGVGPFPPVVTLSDFGIAVAEGYRRGETSVSPAIADDARLSAAGKVAAAALTVGAAVGVPLLKGDALVAIVAVHSVRPRAWSDDDRLLVCEVAERTWAAAERARATAALRESEARFRALTEAIDDVFYVTDLDAGRIDYLSPSYERIWGRPVSALVADPASFAESIHPDDHGEVARAQAAQARGEPVRSEYRMVRPDGEVRWMLDRCFPIEAPDGRRLSAGVASDITVRKQAETARHEIEEQQRLLGELVPALLWSAGPRGETVTLNRRWCTYTGQSIEETQDFGWLAAIHPDDLAGTQRAFEHAFATGEPLEHQHRILKAGNGHRWHLVRHVPVRGEDGAIARWFGAAIDIQDLHEMQQHQRMLVAELQHRVRNILTVTRLTFARTFEQGDDMDEMASHFRGRLDAMARTQVTLSRTAHRSADLEELIRDELLSVGATDATGVTLEGPGVALDHKVAESLGMAFHELTTNALKYGALKGKGGTLDVRWHTHIGEGGEQVLDLLWQERGVPAVSVRPAREGFGRELIEEALPYRIRAKTSLEFRGGGVRCSISVPLPDRSGAADEGGDGR